jgi:beta-N-acetylhexosaminidase
VGGTSTDRARLTSAVHAVGLRTGSGTVVRLLGSADSHGSGAVIVALNTPYGLANSSATVARIAAYGRTPAVFASLAQVLAGTATAPGRLPVTVGAHPIGTGCPR